MSTYPAMLYQSKTLRLWTPEKGNAWVHVEVPDRHPATRELIWRSVFLPDGLEDYNRVRGLIDLFTKATGGPPPGFPVHPGTWAIWRYNPHRRGDGAGERDAENLMIVWRDPSVLDKVSIRGQFFYTMSPFPGVPFEGTYPIDQPSHEHYATWLLHLLTGGTPWRTSGVER